VPELRIGGDGVAQVYDMQIEMFPSDRLFPRKIRPLHVPFDFGFGFAHMAFIRTLAAA
jgi:hypothetical protein